LKALEELKIAAELKRRECRITAQAYSATLSALAPANFVLVVGAALLSLVAGATILIENSLVTKIQSGVLALVSGALTIIHSKLACEQYQAECKKLLSFHRGIAEDYANLQFVTDTDEFQKRIFALNDQLSAAAKNTTAWPFDWATTKARKGIEDA
jgi:hypothetical protein